MMIDGYGVFVSEITARSAITRVTDVELSLTKKTIESTSEPTGATGPTGPVSP
jgi:hypothetical protein